MAWRTFCDWVSRRPSRAAVASTLIVASSRKHTVSPRAGVQLASRVEFLYVKRLYLFILIPEYCFFVIVGAKMCFFSRLG